MAQERIRVPASMGGLVRYFEEYKSKIEFKPGHVIVFAIAVIVLIVLLHIYGAAIVGA